MYINVVFSWSFAISPRSHGQAWHGPAYVGARVLCCSARHSNMVHLASRAKAGVGPSVFGSAFSIFLWFLVFMLQKTRGFCNFAPSFRRVLCVQCCVHSAYEENIFRLACAVRGTFECLTLREHDRGQGANLLLGCFHRGAKLLQLDGGWLMNGSFFFNDFFVQNALLLSNFLSEHSYLFPLSFASFCFVLLQPSWPGFPWGVHGKAELRALKPRHPSLGERSGGVFGTETDYFWKSLSITRCFLFCQN